MTGKRTQSSPRLAAFVVRDAGFNDHGSGTLSTRKVRNIEDAVRRLFGPNLVKLYPGRFDIELSHEIHSIIAQGGLIDGAGKILDSEEHSEFVSDGNRSKPMSKREVNEQLDELFSFCSSLIDKRESLSLAEKFTTAAYFLHRFLAIHPYCDGNGRVARLLTSLLLMRLGAAVHPVCFNLRPENRQRYIAGLNAKGDVTGPESEPLRALAQLLEEAARDTKDSLRLHTTHTTDFLQETLEGRTDPTEQQAAVLGNPTEPQPVVLHDPMEPQAAVLDDPTQLFSP